MDELDRKKLEVQLKKIDATIAELELKIYERRDDIKRLEDHIILQRKLETETKEKLNEQ